MQLYNKLSAQERAQMLEEAGTERLTLSFYQYAHIGNPQLFRDHLFISWDPLEVLGRIYVAYEGINAQLSVPAPRFDEFKAHLDSISFLEGVRLNIAIDQDIKLKDPENEGQQNDWDTWCPGVEIGETVNSPLNPVLFSD